jgi:hypothetical protein
MIETSHGIEHVQESPATTWVINHNKGRGVCVDVIVSFGGKMEKILPWRIQHTEDLNTTTIKFTTPFKGIARIV